MGASVRIEDEAFSDERYEDLAAHAGLVDADHARGKMARLWRQCTLEQTHILGNQTVMRVLGPLGVDALIHARLGERVDDNRTRIRGTKGRIEWLKKLRDNGRKGGRPKRQSRKPSGFPPANPSGSAEANPPAPAPAPAPALPEEDRSSGSAEPSRPKARSVVMPDGWEPKLAAIPAGVNAELELAQFRDHHAARASRFVDWDAAWRTWLRNAAKFSAGRSPPKQTPLEAQLERVRKLEAEEAERRPS